MRKKELFVKHLNKMKGGVVTCINKKIKLLFQILFIAIINQIY